MEKKLEITEPKHGWSKLIIRGQEPFEGQLSYIQNLPYDFLEIFKVYLEKNVSVALECDEEGSCFTIVLMHHEVRIIIDREESTVITPDISPADFIFVCCSEFEKHISEWASFTCTEIRQDDLEKYEANLQNSINEIRRLLNIRLSC